MVRTPHIGINNDDGRRARVTVPPTKLFEKIKNLLYNIYVINKGVDKNERRN